MPPLPAVGSLVRRAADDDAGPAGEVGRVVHHLDDSVARTGPDSVVVDFAESGTGIYLPDELEAVLPPPS